VAVQVVEVIDGVPSQFGEDSTQPVDVGNPFMADEPTQTAFTAGGVTTPGATIALTSRQTQPMRAQGDDRDDDAAALAGTTLPMRSQDDDSKGSAPTVPPPMRDAKARDDKKKSDKKDEPKSEDEKTEVDGKSLEDDAAPKADVATADTGPAPAPPKKD